MSWEINLHSRKQNFHRFGTDDFALLEIGIGNYNLSSLATFFGVDDKDFLSIKPPNPDVLEFFSNERGLTVINKLVGENNIGDMAIMEFDQSLKTYKETVGFPQIKFLDPQVYKFDKFTQPQEGSIKTFLNKWNDIQRGIETTPKIVNGYKAVIYRIQNSMSGCITFNANLSILGQPRRSLVRLYLMDSSDTESSRTISFNGSPIITDFPKTVTGLSHSFGSTSASGPGAFITPNKGDNNPQDKVAGKMAMVYDSSTGEWQSGTQQMLARLLTDIDAANVPDLTLEQLEGMNRVDNYESGTDSDLWLGGHTTGQAIPLSAEKGNPYLFGPDYKDGCEGDKKVKITVINRLNESYKAGQVVVISKMAGENGNWVIVSPGTPVAATKKLGFGNFEYQQYILPASLYFAIPESAERFLPDKWISKFRDDYYVNLLTDKVIDKNTHYTGNDMKEITRLNVIASTLSGEEDDPIADLIELLDDTGIDTLLSIAKAQINSKIEDVGAFDFFEQHYMDKDKIFHYKPYKNEHEIEIGYPKNILKRSMPMLTSEHDYNTYHKWFAPDPVDVMEVPVFWGMLFPDGYKASQAKKYKSLTSALPLYVDDANLRELSVSATECAYDLGNPLQSLLFMATNLYTAYKTPDGDANKSALSIVRKTGGNFRRLTDYASSFTFEGLYNLVAMNYSKTEPNYFEHDKLITGPTTISQLEPLNPARLQFSSLSLEALYMNTILDTESFAGLKSLIDNSSDIRFKEPDEDDVNTLKEYANKIIFNNEANPEEFEGSFFGDSLNSYNIKPLTLSHAFGTTIPSKTILRHPAPIASVMNAGYVIPKIEPYNQYRLPVMPILTCKSTISTSAEELRFTINENIGLMQKKTVSPGSADRIIVIPLFPPLVLPAGEGNIEPSINATPQWGGDDEIDSFGTTALHVKIYESVPANQLLYLGPIFTPLHFNPSAPDNIVQIEYDKTSGNPKLKKTTTEYSLSPVDFRVPTYKPGSGGGSGGGDGEPEDGGESGGGGTDGGGDPSESGGGGTDGGGGTFGNTDGGTDGGDGGDGGGGGAGESFGTAITIGTDLNIDDTGVAPVSQWRINTIRRGKLLSGGGFAYYKPVFAISSVDPIPASSGINYEMGDIFEYSDGSQLTVTGLGPKGDGAIASVSFTDNINDDRFKVQNSGIIGFQTLGSKAPVYKGESGSGASFKIKTMKLIKSLEYDKPPKSTNIVRLTSSNDKGNSDAKIGTKSTTIELPKSDKKDYDIFYFYHNDPSHYSMDNYNPYNQGFAQHVISEINPV